QGVGEQLQVALVAQLHGRVEPQHARRQRARQAGFGGNGRHVDTGQQPLVTALDQSAPQRYAARRRGRQQAAQLDVALGPRDDRQLARRGQRHPAHVDQHWPCAIRNKDAVDAHADPAPALLVIQQQRAARVEPPRAGGPVVLPGAVGIVRRGQRNDFAPGHYTVGRIEHRLLLDRTLLLPPAQARERRDRRDREQPTHHEGAPTAHCDTACGCDNADTAADAARPSAARRSCLMKTLLIVGFLILILWNLGAGLYYMLVDKGESKRTVNALTRRIVLSIALVLMVVVAAKLGWIEFHGVGR